MSQTYYKLVRDKIPNLIMKDGKRVICEGVKDDERYKQILMDKLMEEANETIQAVNTAWGDGPKKLVDEVADVMDVIDAILKLYGISPDIVMEHRLNKREEKGAFNDRVYLIEVIDNQ